MPCLIHPDREVHALCETCKEPFCEGCLVNVSGKFHCKKHVADLVRNNRTPPSTHYFDNSGYNHYNHGNYPYKSRVAVLLLCVFLGPLGVHRFYAGKVGTGILYLLTMGLFLVGWIFDLVRIASGEFLDANGRPFV